MNNDVKFYWATHKDMLKYKFPIAKGIIDDVPIYYLLGSDEQYSQEYVDKYYIMLEEIHYAN